ncbi:MAG: ATP-binding protein [Acidobacteria bacterium]|nr:ATP-binding protein [Acidobacteriota bacterium]
MPVSEALRTWKRKLDYLQQQEAIVGDPTQKFALREQIEEAKANIAELETKAEGQQFIAPTGFQADISRISKYAPADLIGRDDEKKLLSEAWDKTARAEKGRPHVLTFVALGGEGKTSLVAKWAAELAAQDWPGCDAAFAWSFYSQGTRDQLAASSDLFLKEALTYFGDEAMADSAEHGSVKGKRLAQLVGQRRALLILDGLEPLQYAPTSPTPGELKDSGLAALLRALAAASHGLCVVTTRYSLPDLKAFWQTTAPEVKLLRLSREAGVDLLKMLGVNGTAKEFETLVEDVKGHALTLTLLGGFLQRAFHGDIRQRDRVKFEKADEKMDGGHAFRTMAAYEHWLLRDGGDEGRREVAVLRLMGLFDRPADAGCLAALRSETIPGLTEPLAGLADDDWEYCLSGLETAKLLTVNRDASGALVSLDAHPLLREYFATQLRRQQPEAWRAAHGRLYEHLCATTKDKPQPTLEDLQPLYQAVAHGCQAGMQQEACDEVYYARINRGRETYGTRKLGAPGSDLGAVACFFETLWGRVSPGLVEPAQAWLLNEAAFRLSALGRLTEALEPMRAGIEGAVRLKDWENAAIYSSNLTELELTLGEIAGAVGDAEHSVTYAGRSGESKQRMISGATHADAVHQAGHRAEAEARFREAELLQAEREPRYFLLYSVQGFQYCDLLLAAPERAAWQRMLHASYSHQPSFLPESCRAVSERAAQTLEWVETGGQGSLLGIALDHLTLARTALYAAILEGSSLAPCHAPLQDAVDRLRHAGTQNHIPRGLLTRGWLRSLDGKRTGPESAQEDLDEAWEIAERGPMKLFLADIHLHRARLFFRGAQYPWGSPAADVAEARRLIDKCGYWR